MISDYVPERVQDAKKYELAVSSDFPFRSEMLLLPENGFNTGRMRVAFQEVVAQSYAITKTSKITI